MARMYELSQIGRRMARSVKNPDNPFYRVISHMDKMGVSTTEQIADYTGMSTNEASVILSKLEHRKAVVRVG